jgi:hypothetical protein
MEVEIFSVEVEAASLTEEKRMRGHWSRTRKVEGG